MDSRCNSNRASDVLPSRCHSVPNISRYAISSTSYQQSSRRRERAVNSPPSNVSSSTPGLGVRLSEENVSAPLPAAPLSVPFSQRQSPRSNSAGVPSGSSPMASSRHTSRSPYAVPYNPQDWDPVTSVSNNRTLRIVSQLPLNGPDSDTSLSPPPPYSPPSRHLFPGTDIEQSISTGRMIAPETVSHPPPPPSLPPLPPPLQRGNSDTMVPSRSSVGRRRDHSRRLSSFSGTPSPSITLPRNDEDFQYPSLNNHDSHFESPLTDVSGRPPSSIRAASAGAITGSATPSKNARGTSHSTHGSPPMRSWEPGMPLPPPPPGPPPCIRSRSVGSLLENTSDPRQTTQVPARRRRPPPVMGTGLGSIPPTPAGWVDEESTETSRKQDKQRVPCIDTAIASPSDDSRTPKSPRSGVLLRSSAARDSSVKGIRERRIKSKNGQSQISADLNALSSSSDDWAQAAEKAAPLGLVLPDAENESEQKYNPTSARFTPSNGNSVVGFNKQQAYSRHRASSTGLFSNQRSPLSTHNPDPSPAGVHSRYAQTPPFSPNGKHSPSIFLEDIPKVTPMKILPTPPPNFSQGLKPVSHFSPTKEGRRASPRLDSLNVVTSPDYAQLRRGASTRKTPSLDSGSDQKSIEFLQSAAQRHQKIIEKEAAAANGSEALMVFADFIVTESQMRRERYAESWDSCSLNLEQIRNELFKIPMKPIQEPEASQVTPVPLPNWTSATEMATMEAPESNVEPRWNTYKPSLSPIASLKTSNDEMSSRGRPPSRWWESKTGSSSDEKDRTVQRSKRELKYMGLPREQWGTGQTLLPKMIEENGNAPGPVHQPGRYPPEKEGWHEEGKEEPACQNTVSQFHFQKSEETQRMDISRLITLPPPYPRHHPAVNNSHPDLVRYRTTVRSISDLSEIKLARRKHELQVKELLREHQKKIQESRQQFKSNSQSQIGQGSITFAEAAEAEAALGVEERKLERELARRDLDTYQESVLKPMHTVLVERIAKANGCIGELSSRLFDDAQPGAPDQTQEESDEKPELLEKLTQLKWLFETREQLHREIYELMSDRNEKYRSSLSLQPNKQEENEETYIINSNVHEMSNLFLLQQNTLDLRVEHEASALARLESFLDVTEGNVVRGVEIQLSAFWDIAPSLLALIHQIPEDLEGFQVQIPTDEYEENPSYDSHPLQYLYFLLSHAKKSSYQYIESQTNLLCLLHEVKSAVTRANSKMMEAEQIRQGEPEDVARRNMLASRHQEERVLTADLKDRVSTIEGQWTEALGSQMQSLLERIKEQLIREGGWDDTMEHFE